MSEVCIGENCKVDVGSKGKLEAFDFAIQMCDRFEIAGLTEDEVSFVLEDAEIPEGVEGHFVEISIQEVIEAPLGDILKVLKGERNPIAVKSYTRIVGYYSAVDNWNNSKLSELRDRHEGIYGTPNFNPKHKDETRGALNKMRQTYGN